MKNFYQVLLNTLIANVTTSYLWFALTFWVFLETCSVLAMGKESSTYNVADKCRRGGAWWLVYDS